MTTALAGTGCEITFRTPSRPAVGDGEESLALGEPLGAVGRGSRRGTVTGCRVAQSSASANDGSPMWLSVTAPKTAQSVYTGTLYRTTGPPFNSVPFNPQSVVATPAGVATFTFTNGNAASFTYTLDGVTQTKAITREVFRLPGTTCQ